MPLKDAKAASSPSPTQSISLVIEEIEKVFAGKRQIVELTVAALIAQGHVLLEDVPGMGKTTLAKTLARALDLKFNRIQFTSDMLPSDVLGTHVFNPGQGEFLFRKGPVFCNILLADELNRTSPRTQSALLEAMNERQVTLETNTTPLPAPFFVIATQNPKELYGTYPLPESQLDRFLFSLTVGYPDAQTERKIIAGMNDEMRLPMVTAVLDEEEILALQAEVTRVHCEDPLVDYIYQIISATREAPQFELGASPRAGIQLLKGARAIALVRGRNYVTPEDIRFVAPYALAHRLAIKDAAQLGSTRSHVWSHVEELLDSIQAP